MQEVDNYIHYLQGRLNENQVEFLKEEEYYQREKEKKE